MSAAALVGGIIGAVAEATRVGIEVYRAARGDQSAIVRAHTRLVELARAEAERRKAGTK